MGPIEFLRDVIDDHIVPILSTQAMVSIRRQHFDAMSLDSHDCDIERSAPEIENENGLILIELIEAIRDGRGGRLIDNLQNIEPRELTRRDRGRALGVVEVGWNCDHSIRDRLFQIFFCVSL